MTVICFTRDLVLIFILGTILFGPAGHVLRLCHSRRHPSRKVCLRLKAKACHFLRLFHSHWRSWWNWNQIGLPRCRDRAVEKSHRYQDRSNLASQALLQYHFLGSQLWSWRTFQSIKSRCTKFSSQSVHLWHYLLWAPADRTIFAPLFPFSTLELFH